MKKQQSWPQGQACHENGWRPVPMHSAAPLSQITHTEWVMRFVWACLFARSTSAYAGVQVVSKYGTLALHCRRSAGRFPRHTEINIELHRILATAQIPTRLEPRHLMTENAMRPDGRSLIVWREGNSWLWIPRGWILLSHQSR